MTNTVVHGVPRWSLAVPPLALVVLLLSWGRDLGAILLTLVCAGLGAAVIAAVHARVTRASAIVRVPPHHSSQGPVAHGFMATTPPRNADVRSW
jgi:hypothetical protein